MSNMTNIYEEEEEKHKENDAGQDVPSIGWLEVVNEQIEDWEKKAKSLEEFSIEHLAGSPDRNRMQTKAGVYRACAEDLRWKAKEFASNEKHDQRGE